MATATDPVCGMVIEEAAAAGHATRLGIIYFFCSSACQQLFEADPGRYAKATQQDSQAAAGPG